jgi:hypothetical protein
MMVEYLWTLSRPGQHPRSRLDTLEEPTSILIGPELVFDHDARLARRDTSDGRRRRHGDPSIAGLVTANQTYPLGGDGQRLAAELPTWQFRRTAADDGPPLLIEEIDRL